MNTTSPSAQATMTATVQASTVALPRAADSCMRMLSCNARVRAVGGSGLSASGASGEAAGGPGGGEGFTVPFCAVHAPPSCAGARPGTVALLHAWL